MLLFSRKSGKHVRLDEKLFNKEEEQTAMNKEVPKQIESQPKIPRVNHYTEAREAQMASRNAGKCRFPLVPDNGFDEEDESEVNRFEEQPIQGVTYEEPTAQRGIKVERSRRPYVEKVVSTYEEPEVQYEPVRESVVKRHLHLRKRVTVDHFVQQK